MLLRFGRDVSAKSALNGTKALHLICFCSLHVLDFLGTDALPRMQCSNLPRLFLETGGVLGPRCSGACDAEEEKLAKLALLKSLLRSSKRRRFASFPTPSFVRPRLRECSICVPGVTVENLRWERIIE
jgi:hypothetical protein